MADHGERTNRLLTLLLDGDYERLRPHLSLTDLSYKKVLYQPFRPIDQIFFPIDGVASLVNTMKNGSAAEVGTIGNEGFVGLPVVLGDKYGPSSVYVQVPGQALKLDAAVLRREMITARRLGSYCFLNRPHVRIFTR